MEVTSANFAEILPVVKEALNECTFWAIDNEFTGLSLGKPDDTIDSLEERYEKLANGAKNFLVIQFGLSTFRWIENKWVSKTFNFYVFPSSVRGYDKRFTCQTSSISFLASHGFDFNKFIHQGVPFLPIQTVNKLLEQVDKQQPRDPIVISSENDKKFVSDLRDQVGAWWLHAENNDTLMLPPANSYLRAVSYQVLDEMQAQLADASGLLVQKVEAEGAPVQLQVSRVTAEYVHMAKLNDLQVKKQALINSAGFSQVVVMLGECGKPGVGHNCLLDLLYSMEQFLGPLPASFLQWRHLAAGHFQAGIFDTSHIAKLPRFERLFKGSSALEHVHTTLLKLAAEKGYPPVQHAEGFTLYSAGGAAHDAGYDAFMTGAAFARLLSAMAFVEEEPASDLMQADEVPQLVSSPLPAHANLEVVEELKNKINIHRSDILYCAISGDQPAPPYRGHILSLCHLPPLTAFNTIRQKCVEGGVQSMTRLLARGPTAALLVLTDQQAAVRATERLLAVCSAGSSWEGVRVGSYEDYLAYLVLGEGGEEGQRGVKQDSKRARTDTAADVAGPASRQARTGSEGRGGRGPGCHIQ